MNMHLILTHLPPLMDAPGITFIKHDSSSMMAGLTSRGAPGKPSQNVADAVEFCTRCGFL